MKHVRSGCYALYYYDHEIKDPGGRVHCFCNINAFAEHHGLNKHCLRDVLTGKRGHHRGWTAPEHEERWPRVA